MKRFSDAELLAELVRRHERRSPPLHRRFDYGLFKEVDIIDGRGHSVIIILPVAGEILRELEGAAS